MTPDVLKITIEQEHIDRGLRGRGSACAVALALKDIGPAAPFAGVGEQTAWFRGRRWQLEPRLSQFVHDFDNRRPVEPGEYRLLALPLPWPGWPAGRP